MFLVKAIYKFIILMIMLGEGDPIPAPDLCMKPWQWHC